MVLQTSLLLLATTVGLDAPPVPLVPPVGLAPRPPAVGPTAPRLVPRPPTDATQVGPAPRPFRVLAPTVDVDVVACIDSFVRYLL